MIIGLVEFKILCQTVGPVIGGKCVAITLSPPPLVFNNVTQKNIKPGQAGDILYYYMIVCVAMHVISGIARVCRSVALAITLFVIILLLFEQY